jgi:hypothetical protein
MKTGWVRGHRRVVATWNNHIAVLRLTWGGSFRRWWRWQPETARRGAVKHAVGSSVGAEEFLRSSLTKMGDCSVGPAGPAWEEVI